MGLLDENPAGVPKSQSEEERRKVIQLSSQQNSSLKHPCLKEQEMSFKCISENSRDKSACNKYFENYKACQGFWYTIQMDRRKNGIKPILPPPEEREAIKAEYLKNKKL